MRAEAGGSYGRALSKTFCSRNPGRFHRLVSRARHRLTCRFPDSTYDYFSVSRNPGNPLLYDASGYAVLTQAPPATGWYFDPYYIQFGRDSVANGGSSGIH